MKFTFAAAAIAAISISTAGAAAEIVVTSPTGVFTNAGPSNAAGPGAGLDAWFANNVRQGGSAGISTDYARSGNGSVELGAPSGAKADFEIYFSQANQFLLSQLTSLSYDFLRDSSSTVAGHLHSSLRLIVADGVLDGNGNDVDYLVYEGIYNGVATSPVDAWVSVDAVSKKLWGTGTLPNAFANYDRTAADWATLLPNLKVIGLSFGVGSGWSGSYAGAVDNVAFGINGNEATVFNFETAADVPEPAMLGLFGLGAIGLGLARRRRG